MRQRPAVALVLAPLCLLAVHGRAQETPEPPTARLVATWQGHRGAVHDLSVSSDGRRAATASEDGTVRVWNVATGATEATCQHDDRVWAAAFLPDGDRLVSGGFDGRLTVWDARDGTKVNVFGPEPDGGRAIAALAVSADGALAVTGGFDAKVRLWDLAARSTLAEWTGHADTVFAVAFGPGADQVCSGSFDGTLRIVDRGACAPATVLAEQDAEQRGWKRALVPAKDGRLFVAGAGVVQEWHADGTCRAFAGERHPDGSVSIALAGDERSLATGGFDGHLQLWDAAARASVVRWNADQGDGVWAVAFLPDGRLLSAGTSGTIKLWELGGLR